MNTYSVAIRTLGTSGEALRRELLSLHRQTVAPEKIIIYIARGYAKPDFRIGREEYVEVDKGMVAQRALQYNEISSDCIMCLDDDVELGDNSAEILLRQMNDTDADCIAVDTFANHKMSISGKFKAAIGNFIFPRFNQRWAFKLHSNGSFSYINNPTKDVYPSQSAAGPAALWRKKSLLALRFEDELWLDKMGFAYGDDDLEFYKLHVNGGRLFVSFNCGVINLDSKSSSSEFHKDARHYYIRIMSNTIRWYRMQYEPRNGINRCLASLNFATKMLWLAGIHGALSVVTISHRPLTSFYKGFADGLRFVKSYKYKGIPAYKNENIILR